MSKRNLFWWWSMTALLLCLLLASCASPLPTPTPEPTPMPENDSAEAALEVVMTALGPILLSVAEQIDQGTIALAENTKAVHRSSEPTAGDAMVEALLICIFPICLILLTIAIVLFRDPRLARSIALFVGSWYHKKVEENKTVKSRPAPTTAAPTARPDELEIG